jgi:hypothetical protein
LVAVEAVQVVIAHQQQHWLRLELLTPLRLALAGLLELTLTVATVLTQYFLTSHPQVAAVVEAILGLVAEPLNQVGLVVAVVEETGEQKPLVLEILRQHLHLRVITVEQEVHPLQITAGLVEAVLVLRVVMDHQLLVVLGRLVLRQALPVLA